MTTRLSPTPDGISDEDFADYRFLLRFDRNFCDDQILSGINVGRVGVEVTDYRYAASCVQIY